MNKKEWIASGFLGGTMILGAAGVTYGLLVADLRQREYRENLEATLAETGKCIREACELSAGADRIWTTKEKREFLDSIGVRGIIGEGQDIYFRINDNNNKEIDVIAGYNLENDGRLLMGSSAKSGTLMGKVSVEQFKQYVDNYRGRKISEILK